MNSVRLQRIECGTCGVVHAIPKIMYDKCLEEGGFWHCPNGHSRGFKEGRRQQEARWDALRQERDRAVQNAAFEADMRRQESERAEREKRSAAAYKGAATRMKNRAKAGVCPCCNRTFQNLARHMASQHPDHETDNIVELGQVKA